MCDENCLYFKRGVPGLMASRAPLRADLEAMVRQRFFQIYVAEYGEPPSREIEGFLRALLAGELYLVCLPHHVPQTCPLDQIMPIFCRAFLEVVDTD